MKLNMTIISDYLDSQDIKRKQTNRPFSFYLESVEVCTGERFRESCLYIADAEDLPDVPEAENSISLICIGKLPEIYRQIPCEYLCVEEGTDITRLFQKAAEIFRRFQDIEVRILRCLVDHAPMNEIGRILFEVLENPVSFATPVFRIMMYVPGKKNHDKNFSLAENAYLPEDEYMVVVSDPEYKETLKTKIPGIFSEKMYGFRKIYYNIFHRQEYLGRLVADEVYRPCRESDLSFLMLISDYVKMAYLDICPVNLGETKEFDHMVKALTVSERPYLDVYDSILRSYGWEKSDTYLYVYLSSFSENNRHSRLAEHMLYLHRILDSNYTFVHGNHIHLILRYPSGKNMKIYEILESFAGRHDFYIGCSGWFSDFEKVGMYYHQAVIAFETGNQTDSTERVYLFEKYILEYMVRTACLKHNKEFYIAPPLAALMDYDKKHGTELLYTLKICLENSGRAVIAQEILHVHRTTYLYRIKRIEEITGWQLSDYRTRLYLMLVFEMIDT